MNEQVEIPLSQSKLTFLFIGSIIFIAAGLWFVIKPPTINNPVIGNPTLIFWVGIAAILFFGLCAFFIGKKFSDKSPGLTIDQKGIIDNSSAVAAGFIPWSDIKSINIKSVSNQRFLLIMVNNPDEYINRQNGFIKRKAMEMNHNHFGTPLSISANGLKYNFDQVFKIILDKFNDHKARQ